MKYNYNGFAFSFLLALMPILFTGCAGVAAAQQDGSSEVQPEIQAEELQEEPPVFGETPDFEYQIIGTGLSRRVIITKYLGGAEEVTIPNRIADLPVAGIGKEAFWKSVTLNSVTIPASVTDIGDGAFSLCAGLLRVAIPNSVKSLGTAVFWGCVKLRDVSIGNSVESIGDGAFWRCESLTKVVIPASVADIGLRAFQECKSLNSVTVPASLVSIGSDAFQGCLSLKNVSLSRGTQIGNNAFPPSIEIRYID